MHDVAAYYRASPIVGIASTVPGDCLPRVPEHYSMSKRSAHEIIHTLNLLLLYDLCFCVASRMVWVTDVCSRCMCKRRRYKD